MADKGIPVTLIVANDCHLCERARQVLATISKETTVALREVSWQSEEGISLVRRDGVPFPPVLYISDSLAGYGRLSERALRRKLSRLGR